MNGEQGEKSKVKDLKASLFPTSGIGEIICRLQGFSFSFSFISRRF